MNFPSPVRGAREPVHPLRYELAGLGENSLPTTAHTRTACRTRIVVEDKMDRFKRATS